MKALNASYAMSWAARNGHAVLNASEYDFHDGVIDLSDVREENFVRVSANEVWLRELEASRLAVGKRFFLIDPGNIYQISYYEVTSTAEGPDGFVKFNCATPDVDAVLDYYEAVDEAMVADLSTLVTYEGAELDDQTTDRSISGSVSRKLGFNINTPKIDLGKLGKLKISGGYNTTWSGSYKVGLFVDNTSSISQTNTLNLDVSLSKKLYENAEYSNATDQVQNTVKNHNELVSRLAQDAADFRHSLFVSGSSYSLPVASVVVFSVAGIINVGITAHLTMEINGSISVSIQASSTTTTTYTDGQNPTKVTKPGVRKITGKVEGEFKLGVDVSAELYILAFKVLTVSLFAGVKATATFDLESTRSKTGSTTNEFSLFADAVAQMATRDDNTVVLDRDINLNMLDVVEFKIDLVVEIGIVLGLADVVTAYNTRITLLDWNFATFHLHLFPSAYDIEPYTDDWDTKKTFNFTRTGNKDNFHLDLNCPYDQKTVKVLDPAGDSLHRYRLDKNTMFSEPEETFVNQNVKLLNWHTDKSLDEASVVRWPYKIINDTTFYPETVPMHWVTMVNGAGSLITARRNQYIYETDDQGDIVKTGDTLYSRSDRVAEREYVDLPTQLDDGTDILWWVRVKDRDDLTVLDYDPSDDSWKLPAGGTFRVIKKHPTRIYLCAVTGKDVSAYFHTGVGDGYIAAYCRKGATLSVPENTATLPRFRFTGWEDENGKPLGETFQTDENTASEIHFYAVWEPSGEVTTAEASDTYIGARQYGYSDYGPDDPTTAFEYTGGSSGITITGLKSGYQPEHLYIPVKIGNSPVTAIKADAFKNNSTLVSVTVPYGVVSIGSSAFYNCSNLEQIDLSACGVTSLPSYFAASCPKLGRVLLPVGVKLESIGTYAFQNCRNLDRIRVSSNIATGAFYNCSALVGVSLAGGVHTIGSNAFYGCTSLGSLTVPDSVTSLGDGFVMNCTNLETLAIEASIASLKANQLNIGADSKLATLILGGTIQTLGEKAIANDTNGFHSLTRLTLPPMLKNVGSYLLQGAAVEDLTLSFASSGLSLSSYAFAGCNTLKTVTVRSGYIPNYAFYNSTALETVNVDAGVTAIGDYAFSGCAALTHVNLPDGKASSLRKVGSYAFNNCASIAELRFPGSVKSYGAGMIQGCTGLKTLYVDGVKGLKLTAPTSTGSALTNPFYIGSGATLEALTVVGGVRGIGDYVFANATNGNSTSNRLGFPTLRTLTLGEDIASIGAYAFSKAGISEVELGSQLTISDSAFRACDRLTKVTLDAESIGPNVFAACPNLTTVVVRGGKVPGYAFDGCSQLTTVTLGSRVTEIGEYAFRNCTGLTRLEIPKSVARYGAGMLYGCLNLEYLSLGGGVANLTGGRDSSSAMTTAVLNPFYIGEGSKLKTLVIGEGVTGIDPYTFANAYQSSSNYVKYFTQLSTVVLPSTLGALSDGNLCAWKQVARLTLPSGISSLTETGTVPAGLTLYSEEYSNTIASFATSKGLEYVVDSGEYPSFTLTCVAPAEALSAAGLTVSDGALTATRGLGGVTCVLPEGWAVLSEATRAYGDSVAPAAPPVKAGCAFRGWYVDPELTIPWSLNAMPGADLTLYAKIDTPVNVDYIVASDTLGTADAALPEGCRLLARFKLLPGENMPAPETAPEREGYRFLGWFVNPEATVPWVLDKVPEGGATLYAGFERLTQIRFAVNAPSLGTADAGLPAGFALYATLAQATGAPFAFPADPAASDCAFEGWYFDPEFRGAFSMRYAPVGDLTVYGKLTRLAPGGRYRAVSGGVQLVSYQVEEDGSAEVHLPAVVNGKRLVSIGPRAFENGGVSRLYLPDTLVSLDPDAFTGSGIQSVNIGKSAANFATVSGVLYDKDIAELIYYPAAKRGATYAMPGTVTKIAARAVENNPYLKTVNFSQALTEIGARAFSGCAALEAVALPDACAVLRAGAFSGCNAIRTFTAYGLTTIEGSGTGTAGSGSAVVDGQRLETIPRNTGAAVYGPLQSGALRDWFTYRMSDGTVAVLQYNQYPLTLVLGSQKEQLSNEAGMPLLKDVGEVSFDDGSFVEAWYTDSALTQPWDMAADLMPAEALTLYGSRRQLFEYESGTVTVDGEEASGAILTGYNGSAARLTIPATLGGTPVVGIGAAFMAASATAGTIAIGSHVLSIEEGAMAAFTGTVVCDAGSAAEAWAQARGLETDVLLYTLTLVNEGKTISPRSAAKGASLILPRLTSSYRGFTGWYTDAKRAVAAELDEEACYIMPGANATLYAGWDTPDETVPFSWTAEGGEVTITGYTGSDADAVVPETINGWPVVAVAAHAFQDAAFATMDLGSVRTVGAGAFEDCSSLRSVTMRSVAEVGDEAFLGCGSLSALSFSDALKSIGARAFAECEALGAVSLPNSLTALGERAFDACGSLKTVNLGSGLRAFDAAQVSGCERLTDVNVTATNPALSSVDGVLFDKAGERLLLYPRGRAATAYAIPGGVTAVGENAFDGAAQLTSVTVPDSVTALMDGAFRNSGLTAFTASGLTTIAGSAFFCCERLTEVEPGNALEAIGANAFVGCDALLSVHIPETAQLDPDDVLFTGSGVVITGKTNSSAHAYALANDILFNDPSAVPVTELALDRESAVLKRGESLALAASTLPDNADSGTRVYWMSSNDGVAIVDQDGLVSAMGGGTATITAITGNGLRASCEIEVQVDVTALAVAPTEAWLEPGETLEPELEIRPYTATDQTIAWLSDNADAATVEDGVIRANAVGEATLTATAHNGIAAEVAVKVYIPITSLTLTAPQQPLYAVEGMNTLNLTATVEPADGTYANPAWSSSDETVATVDENGLVTAHKPGTVTTPE